MLKNPCVKCKNPPICKRCGGQVLRFYDDITCIQCGALYTEDYKLVTLSVPEEWQALTKMLKVQYIK